MPQWRVVWKNGDERLVMARDRSEAIATATRVWGSLGRIVHCELTS